MAMGVTGYAGLASMLDEVQVHGVKGVWIADLFEEIVGFNGRYPRPNQPHPLRNPMHMRIYGKGGTAE